MKNPFSKKAAKKQAEPIGPEPDPMAEMHAIDAIIGAAMIRIYEQYNIAILQSNVKWVFESKHIPKGSGISVSHEFIRMVTPPKATE